MATQNTTLFEYSAKHAHPKLIKVADLEPHKDLKLVFREIRDYFVGNVTGITRDEKIAQNIMRLLFCKIYDETNSSEMTDFSNRPGETLQTFNRRIFDLFENVKRSHSDIFEKDEKFEIQPEQLSFIVSKLENYSILQAERDVIGDAFEELIGTSFRGGEGQFFTPRNVVQMMVDVLQPKDGESIIDPACGSGGFLAHTTKYLLASGNQNFKIAGIDKDSFLVKIAKTYLSLLGGDDSRIHCENSLAQPSKWDKDTKGDIQFKTFDVILTNPPFGSKIPVIGKDLLRQYKLGHRWNKGTKWAISKQLLDKQPPQILFIERCLQLLREDGRMGIVLPEGIFGNPSDRYIWEYISSVASVLGVVSLSQETFQPSTHTKTSVLFLKKTTKRPKSIFMAIARKVGHNKNGKPIYRLGQNGEKVSDDDLPSISTNFMAHNGNEYKASTHLGFSFEYKKLNDHIFIPEYYDPEISNRLSNLKLGGKHTLVPIGELLDTGILQVKRGNEIGSHSYGTGTIPFVRTSDIVNWEIKCDPIKAVSEEVYRYYKTLQDIKQKDILFVNDGTFLIGRVAMVTKLDTKIVIQSHVRKIRVLNTSVINPYYLFYLLNSKIVRRQIDSKTFVQATISTIGNRIREVVLPISNDKNEIKEITSKIKSIIEAKAELREASMKITEASI